MSIRKILTPGRTVALGFLSVILLGSILLSLPVAHTGECEVTYLDALFTSTSCVCVTGLATVELGTSFSLFGHIVALILIQIGGLGITTLGAGLFALAGGKLGIRSSGLVKEALNYQTWHGIRPLIKAVLLMDFSFELAGAVLSFFTLVKMYPVGQAVWISVFHSVSAFNNAGFDIFGNGNSLAVFTGNVYFNIVTALLIIFGGLGFFVIRELITRRRGDRLSLHTKIVILMTSLLIVAGTLVIKLTEGDGISWVGAWFASVTARTAGFATYPMGGFTNAGIVIMCVLMFIGASPGSTGGGVKTTTLFTVTKNLISYSTGRETRAFKRKIPDETGKKAFVIIGLGLAWVVLIVLLLSILNPGIPFRDVMFECFSAFGTVGLSTGITSEISAVSKVIIIFTMFVGRLGPLSIASLWTAKKSSGLSRPEENYPIG
ncbi:MAG: H(+)-transporting ATPase [Clostridia bacterium]|nr:H(+)-transporting ATPase [Clostridia bacterium]